MGQRCANGQQSRAVPVCCACRLLCLSSFVAPAADVAGAVKKRVSAALVIKCIECRESVCARCGESQFVILFLQPNLGKERYSSPGGKRGKRKQNNETTSTLAGVLVYNIHGPRKRSVSAAGGEEVPECVLKV